MTKRVRHSIQGVYKGIWCDSSWELAFVLYNLDNGIKFARNTTGFPYLWYGKRRLYYPDFRMDDGTYVEIKGVMDGKSKRKISSFQYGKLKVLGPKEIKPMLDYAEVKYGKDFWTLFDRSQVATYVK